MLSYFGLVLFSIWLLYDIKRISDGGETSVVRATFSIYLNLINIFLSPVSYTHLRAHETDSYLVCRLLLEKKNLIHISEPTRPY